ncbi:hypothetical protein CV102_11760 [Natronococcus pandeyae]|uniref:Uncharacterized protein n=1 Tax=Natronococcus pandeyae TaxID=2055836 RepID=A0A8J8Q1X9_9EURY|nr:hypothetical protein [Natronococcus pandeyae]TYL38630.1 hypothetical protein CV102_11760 [Natronococcus pandeyae]
MNGATAVLLALLLVVSLPAVAVTAADSGAGSVGNDLAGVGESPQQEDSLHVSSVESNNTTEYAAPVEANDTTNRLQLDGDVRSEHTDHSNDLGTALASSDDELRVDHKQYRLLDREFDDASTEEQAEMVEAAYDRLKERSDGLESREREVVREHADGGPSTTELIQTLIRNHNEAEVLSSVLSDLRDRANEIRGYSISPQEANAVDKVLNFHTTPIRSDLESTMQPNQRTELLIQTSEDGYSISTVDDRNYVVETTRFSHRDTDKPDQFATIETSEALDRTMVFYPWADTHGSPHFQDHSSENLYWLDVGHTQGALEVYVDGGTASVHREIQQLRVASLPTTDETNWIEDDLELSITETPANGPAKVSVTGADDDEPQNATVSVDGTEVGETGIDGTLWILPPASEYDVEVASADGTVEVTVSGGEG